MAYAENGRIAVREFMTFNKKQYSRYSNMRSRPQATEFTAYLRKKYGWRARAVEMYDKETKDRYNAVYIRKGGK